MTLTSERHVEQRDALLGRVFEATLGAFDLLAIHLGLDLGLYEALALGGPATAPDVAGRARIDARYAREWLEQQAVTGILTVDDVAAPPDERRYSLAAGHAEALLDLDSLGSVQSMPRSIVSAARALPTIAAAYRSGDGVGWADYAGLIEAQEVANRPAFKHLLSQEWLPAVPDVEARLRSAPAARVADLACGAGWSSIAIARGYPLIQVDGLDIDPESIERARRNAAAEGVGEDRLRFHRSDASQPDLAGRYDLVTIFEAVHDLSQPAKVLAAARRLLAPGGTVIVADEKVAESFTAPGDEIERLMYGYSLVFCLANGLVDKPSVGTGTVMRPDTLRGYATAAGFTGFTTLPIEHDTFRFYRLDP
jgi:2-polyprenyl-3-methyl-5-hydroxy-6-metoxy-1,4-benzoquinol methylase